MKTLLIVILSFACGFWAHSCKSATAEITYNDKGAKTVVVSCEKEKDCVISIGQQCEDLGYKMIKTDHDDQKTIITAECGKEKETTLLW